MEVGVGDKLQQIEAATSWMFDILVTRHGTSSGNPNEQASQSSNGQTQDWKGCVSFLKNLFITSPKEQKKSDLHFRYIPICYIPIGRGYMANGYEMGIY